MTKHPAKRPAKAGFTLEGLTLPGVYLLALAGLGWVILIANMFDLAGRAGWIFPVVPDITGLGASTIILAMLGLTPLAVKQLFNRMGKPSA